MGCSLFLLSHRLLCSHESFWGNEEDLPCPARWLRLAATGGANLDRREMARAAEVVRMPSAQYSVNDFLDQFERVRSHPSLGNQ